MTLVQIAFPEGTHTFVSENGDLDVQPLDHAALAAIVTRTETEVSVVLRGLRQADADGELIPNTPKVDAKFPWAPYRNVTFFGLTLGGWVPPVFGNGRVALLDRNMIFRLRNLALSGESLETDTSAPDWLYQVFAASQFEVSPAMHLLEGDRRRPPTLAEMTLEMHSLTAELKARMPNAKLHELGSAELLALHATGIERHTTTKSVIVFLLAVVPLLVNPSPPKARPALEEQIFAAAQCAGLGRRALCVLAALSCIYEDPRLPGGPIYRVGRALIKPRQSFSEQHAYNAASDLAALELLINSNSLLIDYRGVFFTEDVGLAAFWTALQPRDAVVENTTAGKARTTVTLTLTQALLPGLSNEERADLVERLQC